MNSCLLLLDKNQLFPNISYPTCVSKQTTHPTLALRLQVPHWLQAMNPSRFREKTQSSASIIRIHDAPSLVREAARRKEEKIGGGDILKVSSARRATSDVFMLSDRVRVSGQELHCPLAVLCLVTLLALTTFLDAQVPSHVGILFAQIVVEGTWQRLDPHRVLLQLVGLQEKKKFCLKRAYIGLRQNHTVTRNNRHFS